MTDVLTWHNDNARTGQALHEEILTPANVRAARFGKLWVLPVDGKVDAQPLYAAGVPIPGVGVQNVLFVATEHGSVYAFDADSTNLFWQVSLLGPGETPSDARGCDQVTPEIGITATPVIDRQLGPNGTLFALAMSTDGVGNYFQRLHALDLATGADVVGPATIAALYPGTGDNSSGGFVYFDPSQYKERAALLLLGGAIYTTWASHCDEVPYTGWVIAYDEQTLAQTGVLNTTANNSGGATWMSGAGPAADGDGFIYLLAGNGGFDDILTPDGFPSRGDFGNAFLKISTAANSLAVSDYFATWTNAFENDWDLDLGSGGVLVLPDMVDAANVTRHLAVGAGKDQNLYLVDRSNMGKFNPTNNNAIYQELGDALVNGVWSAPAYFNGTLYYGPLDHALRAFPFHNARLGSSSSQSATGFPYPGATLCVSANGTNNGIVWAVENLDQAVLHAYDASDLGIELYNSTQAAGNRDQFGAGNKFITPTIASARVYAGTTNGVGVFGLLDSSSLTPLQQWRNAHFGNPSDVGAGADSATPALDGTANLIKYALGLDPFTPVLSSQLPWGGISATNNQRYATLFVSRARVVPDVSYAVQVSNDLNTWTTGAPRLETLVDSPTELVVRDTLPLAAGSRFIRLVIARQ
jgi:hypothetical protein